MNIWAQKFNCFILRRRKFIDLFFVCVHFFNSYSFFFGFLFQLSKFMQKWSSRNYFVLFDSKKQNKFKLLFFNLFFSSFLEMNWLNFMDKKYEQETLVRIYDSHKYDNIINRIRLMETDKIRFWFYTWVTNTIKCAFELILKINWQR